MPSSTSFGPLNGPVESDIFRTMTVDEYETIRLIDMEGFTQETCADHMHIARTTVQRIYNDARKKLAECLVSGKILRIEGGDFQLCDGREETCECGGCMKHRMGRGTAGNKRWGVNSLSSSNPRVYQKTDDQ